MTLDLAADMPHRFTAAIALSGVLRDPQPQRLAGLAETQLPILIVHGEHDQVVPVERARATRDALLAAGLKPEYHELPMGHEVPPPVIQIMQEFLQRVLAIQPV